VHRAVVQHREWFLETVTGLFAEIETAEAEHAGRHFVMIRDGAMSAGYLGDPVLAGETLLRGIEGLLRIHAARGRDDRATTGPATAGPSASAPDAPAARPAQADAAVADIDCSPPGA
jgi:hypothetical protein